MKLYALTDLGKKAVRNGSGSAEELRVLEFLWNSKTATEDELDVVGERWLIRHMSTGDGRMIKELKAK